MGCRFACVVVATMLLAPIASASDAPPPLLTDVVDTLEVVSDRPELLESVPTFATVHYIAAALERVTSVSDVIEQGAGVHVRRYGGLGSYSTASIRASSPGQVEVYLDGVPMNSATYGSTNLADLPLDGLERIEVYRGGAPVGFGTPGIGGVVNLVTRPPEGGTAGAVVSAGSYDTYRIDLTRSGGLSWRKVPSDAAADGLDHVSLTGAGDGGNEAAEDLRYALTFHHLQSEGDFEYLDHHGTPENEADDEIVTRENNAFKQTDLLVRLDGGPWAGWDIEASNEAFWKRSGVPGIENVHIKSVHYTVFRSTARLSVAPPRLAGGSLSFKLGAFHVATRDRFYNPEDEVGFDRWDSDDRSRSYGTNLKTTYDWHAARQSLSLFGEARRERFTPESENPNVGVGFTRRRDKLSLAGEDRAYLFGDALELVLGYRYQEATDNYASPPPVGGPPEPLDELHRTDSRGPSYGARLKLLPNVTFKANRTEYARFPSMVELFGSSGYVQGNAELSPEKGTTTDVGLLLSGSDDASLELVLFWADREDLIVFLQNSQRTVKAFNLDAATVQGAEVTVHRTWPYGIGLSASYTFQDARNEGPSPIYEGKRLPYEPRHDLFVRTQWERGRLALWHEYHHQGEAYRDRANLEENLSPASDVHNAGLRVDIVPDELSISLEVRNLTDERIVDVEGYPLPGRTFYATLMIGD